MFGYFNFDIDEFINTAFSGGSWRNRRYYDNTEPKEGDVTITCSTAKQRFTNEQLRYIDKLKNIAIDVEYEEIQS